METNKIRDSPMITHFGRVLYTARVHTICGSDGSSSHISCCNMNIKHSTPVSVGKDANPEQGFVAGWSACFINAMKFAADKMRVRVREAAAIDAEVELCLTSDASY